MTAFACGCGEEYCDAVEAARILHVSKGALHNLLSAKDSRLPAPVGVIGRSPLWNRSEIRAARKAWIRRERFGRPPVLHVQRTVEDGRRWVGVCSCGFMTPSMASEPAAASRLLIHTP